MKWYNFLSLWWRPTSEKVILAIICLAQHMTREDIRQAWQYLRAIQDE